MKPLKNDIPREWEHYTAQFQQGLEIVPAMQYDIRKIGPQSSRVEFFKPSGALAGAYWDRERHDPTVFDYYNPLPNPGCFLIQKLWISGLTGNLLRGRLRLIIGNKVYIDESLWSIASEMMVTLSPALMIPPLLCYSVGLDWGESGSPNDQEIELMVTMVGQKARAIQ